MPKPTNQFETEVAEAAARIDQARATGQLSLFAGEAGAEDARSGGRGKGKALSTLRQVLAQRGHQMPEDVLARIAALDDPEGPEMAALKKAEAVALAIYGHGQATPSIRLRLFETFYAAQIRALDAMLPYGLAKITPDVAVTAPVQVVVMPAGPTDRASAARDVTPGTVAAGRMRPPPMPNEIQQNQGLGDGQGVVSE
jgi:hypothetical protein